MSRYRLRSRAGNLLTGLVRGAHVVHDMTGGVVARVHRRWMVQGAFSILLVHSQVNNVVLLTLMQVKRLVHILEAEAEVVGVACSLSGRTTATRRSMMKRFGHELLLLLIVDVGAH